MQINELIANSENYAKERVKAVKYIVVHYTANNGDTAKSNANYFKNNVVGASAHYFVDENEIYRSVKEEDTAWHCGGATYYHNECRNNNSIGVELCSRRDTKGDYYFKDEVVERAIEFVKELMKKYDISAENVIRHYDVTHKVCPAPFVNDTSKWGVFAKALTEQKGIKTADEAIKKLNQMEIISTTEYWYNAVKCVKYLDLLLINCANICKSSRQRTVKTGIDAINELIKAGAVQSPDFWAHAIVTVKYLEELFINLGSFV